MFLTAGEIFFVIIKYHCRLITTAIVVTIVLVIIKMLQYSTNGRSALRAAVEC